MGCSKNSSRRKVTAREAYLRKQKKSSNKKHNFTTKAIRERKKKKQNLKLVEERNYKNQSRNEANNRKDQ